MDSKRGQITPIIIVAIVIGIGFGIYFIIPEGSVEKVDPLVEPIYNFVQGCLEESAHDAVLDVSRSGGYLVLPEDNSEGFPYYVKNGKRLMPSVDQIGREISDYIEIAVYFCVNDFKNFPSFDVVDGRPQVRTVIKNNEIDISVDYPLTISKEDNVFEVSDFRYSIDGRLGKMIDLADFLVRDQLDHPLSLCLSCGFFINQEYEMSYNNLALGEGRFLHSISDSKIKIDNQPLELNFVMGLEVDG